MDAAVFGQINPLLTFVLGGLLVGLVALWRFSRLSRENARLSAELASEREKTKWLLGTKDELAQVFSALASSTLEKSSRSLVERTQELLGRLDRQLAGQLGSHKAELAGLVEPLRENLNKLEKQVLELEQKRESAYGSLEEQLRELAWQQQELRQATTTLGTALKGSSARGLWGELQLKRIIELAGMTAHVDFEEQVHTAQGRPDLAVYLPGGGQLPVDAKAPLAAYLKAVEADDEAEKRRLLGEHARQVRARVRELAGKEYWRGFAEAPEFVVLFVPSEAALAAAFEADGKLLDDAMARRVLIAGPVTLLALLKAVAYGWQQRELSENARHLAEAGQELVERFERFSKSLAEVGAGLQKSLEAYNRTVGSYRSRLLPAARRFAERAGRELGEELSEVEGEPRDAGEPPL
ncbi:DNA recombination protein RmuC [Oceanithermus sp.]